MIKEAFKKFMEETGGVENLVEMREEIMELVCAIDDVIELEAKLDSVEVSDKEIVQKLFKMVLLMDEIVD